MTHPKDRRSCSGAADEVVVVDSAGQRFEACVLHAATMLASTVGSKVYAGSRPGGVVKTYWRAWRQTPFDFEDR